MDYSPEESFPEDFPEGRHDRHDRLDHSPQKPRRGLSLTLTLIAIFGAVTVIGVVLLLIASATPAEKLLEVRQKTSIQASTNGTAKFELQSYPVAASGNPTSFYLRSIRFDGAAVGEGKARVLIRNAEGRSYLAFESGSASGATGFASKQFQAICKETCVLTKNDSFSSSSYDLIFETEGNVLVRLDRVIYLLAESDDPPKTITPLNPNATIYYEHSESQIFNTNPFFEKLQKLKVEFPPNTTLKAWVFTKDTAEPQDLKIKAGRHNFFGRFAPRLADDEKETEREREEREEEEEDGEDEKPEKRVHIWWQLVDLAPDGSETLICSTPTGLSATPIRVKGNNYRDACDLPSDYVVKAGDKLRVNIYGFNPYKNKRSVYHFWDKKTHPSRYEILQEVFVPPPADTSPPTITLTYPAQNQVITLGDSLNITGTASDENPAAVSTNDSRFAVNSGTYSSWIFANTSALGSGNYSVKITANDTFGNSAFVIANFAIVSVADTTPPTITLTFPTSGQSFPFGPLNITGTASDANPAFVVTNDSHFSVNSGTYNDWIFANTSTLGSGNYSIRITANDTFGNSAFVVATFTILAPPVIDTTPPDVTIFKPENTTIDFSKNVELSFLVTDNVAVDINSCSYSLNAAANVSIAGCANTTFNASEGSNSITVFARDAAGNLGSATRFFSVVTPPPPPPQPSPPARGGAPPTAPSLPPSPPLPSPPTLPPAVVPPAQTVLAQTQIEVAAPAIVAANGKLQQVSLILENPGNETLEDVVVEVFAPFGWTVGSKYKIGSLAPGQKQKFDFKLSSNWCNKATTLNDARRAIGDGIVNVTLVLGAKNLQEVQRLVKVPIKLGELILDVDAKGEEFTACYVFNSVKPGPKPATDVELVLYDPQKEPVLVDLSSFSHPETFSISTKTFKMKVPEGNYSVFADAFQGVPFLPGYKFGSDNVTAEIK